MSSSLKIIFLGLLLIFVVGAVVASFIPVLEGDLRFIEHTVNAGELTRGVVVGQTFTAREDNLAGIGVKFATYSNRANAGVVEIHLRESVEALSDLRVGQVLATSLADNQFHRFRFEPIAGSAKKTFFFYIVAPEGTQGQAVTVDLDTRDPYHEGSAYIARPGEAPLDPTLLARSGKQTVDVAFATYHETSLRTASINAARDFTRVIIGTWDERVDVYIRWLELVAPVLAFCLLLIALRGDGMTVGRLSSKTIRILLMAFIVGAILFRLLYAVQLPVTNDEGNYLYDARSLLRGIVAGGDGYVKAPLVIAWVALWQLLLQNTVLAGRLAMVVASSLLVVPLYFLGKASWGQRAGLMAAAAWAFFGAPAVFGIYVHTQSVALLFGVAGIAVLWAGLRKEEPGARWFIGAGMLLAMGVASRKSILALGLVPGILILLESWGWSERVRRLLMVGLPFLIVIVGFVGGAVAWYGCDDYLFLVHDGQRCMGVEEALGINSAEDGLAAVTPEEVENVRAYSLRGMTPFFRESVPLIFLALIGWGLLLETAARRGLRALKSLPTGLGLVVLDQAVPKLLWVLPAGVGWWAWSFFSEYEGVVFQEFGGMQWLWWALGAGLVFVALWPRPGYEALQAVAGPRLKSSQPINYLGHEEKAGERHLAPEAEVRQRTLVAGCLLAPLWVGGLVFFYMNWIKFHANYIVEFLPPLALMSGLGTYLAWQRLRGEAAVEEKHPWGGVLQRLAAGAFLAVVVWACSVSNYVTYMFEHTGTFDQTAVREAALWAQEHIPADQPIFTGAAVVPYVSGHRVALDIAHPRWYAYEFTRLDRQRLETFLPPAETMVAAFREAQWFLHDEQTRFSFLMEYPEIENSLKTEWQAVHEVENLSNPLTFYQRVR